MGRWGARYALIMLSQGGFWGLLYGGKCNFKRVPAELKPAVQAFQRAEKITLGEPIPATKSKTEELIFRAKAKNWKDFDWKFRPLEFVAVIQGQEIYGLACEGKVPDIVAQIVLDFKTKIIHERDWKKVMRAMLLASPCLDQVVHPQFVETMSSEFVRSTDDFVDVIVGTESEATAFRSEYEACSSLNAESKFVLIDTFFPGLEKAIQQSGAEKNMVLRLKRIRPSRMHFESAAYLFKKIDNLFEK